MPILLLYNHSPRRIQGDAIPVPILARCSVVVLALHLDPVMCQNSVEAYAALR